MQYIKKNIPFLLFFVVLLCYSSLTADELPDFKRGEDKAKTFFRKGLIYFHRSEYGAARENFIASLSIMERFSLARKLLSDTYYLTGEWQESLNELIILDQDSRNPYWRNRREVLRMLIAGEGKEHPLTFYNKITGDSFRSYRFRNPTDALVDDIGNLYVLSFGSANIVKFDTNGFPVGNYKGGFARSFTGPLFFTIHKKHLFVSDFASNYVYILNTKGYFQKRFGGKGSKRGKFIGPAGISISPDEKLYIADTGNNRIQKFNLTGEFIQEFGKEGDGKLYSPSGLSVAEDGTIWVVDKGNRRIVRFDSEGNYIADISHPSLQKPRSIKIHGKKVYVADEYAGLLIYEPDQDKWSKLSSFMDHSRKYRKFLRPFSSAYDYTGTLYTIDYARHRIDMFAPRNMLTSNLNVFIEKIELNRFPDISVFMRVKNRKNQDLTGIGRSAFRIIENENIYPLVGQADMKRFNDKLSVSLVFENSTSIQHISGNLASFLGDFFNSFTVKDQVNVIRAGKDSVQLYEFGHSILDVYSKIRKSPPERSNINLGKGIFDGISSLMNQLGPRAVILLVSGQELPGSFKQYSMIRNIQYANAHSIPIIVLSLQGEGEAVERYKNMAKKTGGLFLKVPGSQKEKKLYSFIRSKRDKRYIISYRTKTASDLAGKYMDIRVDVSYRNIIGKSKAGYFVPNNQ
ncbi:MAG: SMP-30/gluconolactonase/LRE family protein [Bacteroidota bacterium]